MKIISKRKDYYDYLQGIYGIDNYKIYNRKKIVLEKDFELEFKNKKEKPNQHFLYAFAINNKVYKMVKTRKGIFPMNRELLKSLGYDKWSEDRTLDFDKTTELNKIMRRPVLVFEDGYLTKDSKKIDCDPILKSFMFHKMLSAHEIYVEVETFMGWMKDNPEPPNKQTNENKILTNGFDLKLSFRHRKKQ
jgi:hypothetical protein